MKFARVYVQPGCPYCEEVKWFLTRNNIEHEIVEVGTDPVLTRGLEAIFALLGQPVQVPVTISLLSTEVILGADPQHFKSLLDLARKFGAISPDAPITLRGNLSVVAG